MLKKQQKWIALLVTLTFAWMLQVSTMPLAAAGSAEQTSFANVEQGPDFVEAVGHKPAPPPKKSILPYVLIGVGVVAVAAVLILVVFKTTYDIVGTWTVNWTWTAGYTGTGTKPCVFSGTKDSGTVSGFYGDNGTYTVDGKNVTWILSSYDPGFKWTGQFDTKDTMSGTVVLPVEGASGTWTATRNATTTSIPKHAAIEAEKSPWNKTNKD
jgi:hypothetical protein